MRRAAGVIAAVLAIATGAPAETVEVRSGDGTPDAGGCSTLANPCNTIQAGVDAALPGDVVNVGAGEYAENVVVTTPEIRLRGAGTIVGAPFASCPGDPSRTALGACSVRATQPECDAAWDTPGDVVPRATACFWTGAACVACDPVNAAALGCTDSCSGRIPAALSIGADDVIVEKLRVRAAQRVGIGVESQADRVALAGVTVEEAEAACIAAAGDDLTVTAARIRSCAGAGIAVDAVEPVLTRNRIAETGGAAVQVRGPYATLSRNAVKLAADGCARIAGDYALVERNRFASCGPAGIRVVGTHLLVSRNAIRESEVGIDVACRSTTTECAGGGFTPVATCAAADPAACESHIERSADAGAERCYFDADLGACAPCNLANQMAGRCVHVCPILPPTLQCDGLVEANRIAGTTGGGCVRALGTEPVLFVERNRGTQCAGAGVAISGVGVVAEDNAIARCGTGGAAPGFAISGRSHAIWSNDARRCTGDGFHAADAELSSIQENRAIANLGDGFDLESAAATLMVDLVAKRNGGGGIEIGALSVETEVTGCRASGNALDFCDEGVDTTVSGGRFGTTGAACTPD
jgi:hypothetical protein